MKIILILTLFAIHTTCFIDYNSDHILGCQKINTSLNYVQSLSTLWNASILHVVDRISYLIFPPVLLLIEIIFIMVFLKYRQTLFRRQGTIFFAIILIETIVNSYYFIHALYVTILPYGQPMPQSFPPFCTVFGILNEAADTSLNCYLFYFIVYTFLNMKTSIKAKQVINIKVLHISVLVISIGWVLFITLDKRLTIDQFGLCGISSLRYNTIQWFFPIFTISSNLAYLSFALYTYYYFKKHMPVNDSLVKRIYHQYESISYFVAVYSILIMLFNVSVGVVYFNCFRDNPLPSLLTFATIMNLSRLLQSIFLLYFIMNDQTIKKKTKKFLRGFFQPKRADSSSTISVETKDIDFTLADYEHLDITLKQKILQLKEQEHQIDLYKIAQIATMISGICVCHMEYINTHTFTSLIRKIHFKEKITFQIEPKTLSDYKIQVSKIPKGDILKGTITMIAPRIFSKLLHSDGLTNVQKSFDLAKNYHKMYNIAQGKGGKGGQFFFFSYDNLYVLKTVTKDEYNFIVQNIEEFFDYYEKNPQTLLAKIYGLYTIRGDDIGRQYDLILMKNVSGCQKKQVIRTYDIKGSKHHRQVIKQKQIYNQLQRLTLKDMDFLKREGKIHISRDKIKKLRAILRKDTMFLKNFNLIDYSLLLIRVNWKQQPSNSKFWHQYQRIQSSLNQHQYYHIGIIDYMQAWNISKKSQNWLKSLLGKKQISSQQPNFYQRRFMQFVQEITYFPHQIYQETPSDVADQNSDNSQYSDQRKKLASNSNLKLLQLMSTSSAAGFMRKSKKQSIISQAQKEIIMTIPHDLSSIKRKQSLYQSDFTTNSFQNQLMKKTDSFNSQTNALSRKNGIVSFKEMDKMNLVDCIQSEKQQEIKQQDFKQYDIKQQEI